MYFRISLSVPDKARGGGGVVVFQWRPPILSTERPRTPTAPGLGLGLAQRPLLLSHTFLSTVK